MRIITFCFTLLFLFTTASATPNLINTAAIKGSNNIIPKTNNSKNSHLKSGLIIGGLIAAGIIGAIAIFSSNHSKNDNASPAPAPNPDPDPNPDPNPDPDPNTAPKDGETFAIINNSGFAADKVYVSIAANNGYWDGTENLVYDSIDNIPSKKLSDLPYTDVPNSRNNKSTRYYTITFPKPTTETPNPVKGAKIFFTLEGSDTNPGSIPVKFTKNINDSGVGGYVTPIPFNYPNYKFDFVEFTTGSYGTVNLSEVDFFGLSLKVNNQINEHVGFNKSTSKIKQDLLNAFENSDYPSGWKSLAPQNQYGVMNPSIPPDGTGNSYFGYNGSMLKTLIADIKNKSSFRVMDKNGEIYTAYVNNTGKGTIDISAKIDDQGTFGTIKISLDDFNTFNVFANSLPLAPGSANDSYTNFSGTIPVAILRGVFNNVNYWLNPPQDGFTYPNNPFAKVLHADSIDGKAYTMGYDDAGEHSSAISIEEFREDVLPVVITIQPY